MYPKNHIIVYVGRRLSADKKIMYVYQPTNSVGKPAGDRICFSKPATIKKVEGNKVSVKWDNGCYAGPAEYFRVLV